MPLNDVFASCEVETWTILNMAPDVVCRDCDNTVNGVTYWPFNRIVSDVPAIDAGNNLNRHAISSFRIMIPIAAHPFSTAR